MERISTEGHSFPHHWTCNTCSDDFREVELWTIEKIKKQLLNRLNKINDVYGDTILLNSFRNEIKRLK